MKYLHVNVVCVYPERRCFDAITMDQLNFIQDISYSNLGTGESGEDFIPEIFETAVISLNDDGSAFLERKYQKRLVDKDGIVSFLTGLGQNGLPGDHTINGPDGSFLKALKGPIAGLGATPLCQMIFLGIENLSRLIAKNNEVITAGTRYYTISDNGQVLTRYCMTSKDINFTENTDDQTSENFEFQFDFDTNGLSALAGPIDPKTKKRINKLAFNVNLTEGFTLTLGENLQENESSTEIYFSFDGASEIKYFNSDKKLVYSKSIVTGNPKVLVQEYIDGSYIRHITGNMSELIDGTKITNSNELVETVQLIKQANATMTNNNSNVNSDTLSL